MSNFWQIDEQMKVLQKLHDNCNISGFQYEVNHGNMSQEEADHETAIQVRFNNALKFALSVLQHVKQHGLALAEEQIVDTISEHMCQHFGEDNDIRDLTKALHERMVGK